jgi:single-strand DNA-binding protein
MAQRTIWGHLPAKPVVQDAGRTKVTRFRVIENTGAYRAGKWVEDETPTTHLVEAWFEVGVTAAALNEGDGVIVVGKEHTEKWMKNDAPQYNRVLKAERFGIIPKAPAKEPEPAPEPEPVSVWERTAAEPPQ